VHNPCTPLGIRAVNRCTDTCPGHEKRSTSCERYVPVCLHACTPVCQHGHRREHSPHSRTWRPGLAVRSPQSAFLKETGIIPGGRFEALDSGQRGGRVVREGGKDPPGGGPPFLLSYRSPLATPLGREAPLRVSQKPPFPRRHPPPLQREVYHPAPGRRVAKMIGAGWEVGWGGAKTTLEAGDPWAFRPDRFLAYKPIRMTQAVVLEGRSRLHGQCIVLWENFPLT
jgi:hypothetical protein